jgi:hypothetical protein
MRVIDASGDEIGTVESVYVSDEDPSTPEAETVTPGASPVQDRSALAKFITDAFTTDEIPEVLQNRLRREGFVRLDASGLFAADRYILPEQIGSVSNDGVTLNVPRAELIRRSW